MLMPTSAMRLLLKGVSAMGRKVKAGVESRPQEGEGVGEA
jgi:hypothetical protein